jgi:hypothetical protein
MALSVAQEIAQVANASIGWDRDAGEAWICIFRSSEDVALVSVDVPIVVLVSDVARPTLAEDTVVIRVASLADPCLKVSREVALAVFPSLPQNDPMFEEELVTPGDLYVATV